MTNSSPSFFVVFAVLAMLVAPALLQTTVEARRGEWPQALQVLTRRPTPEGLRAFEKALEDSSITARALRPWMQAFQYFVLGDSGDKAVLGREGWHFYEPGIGYLTQRPAPRGSNPKEALAAVTRFRDDLAARGIQLLLLPAPNKESIYPDKLTRFAGVPQRVIGRDMRLFLEGCQAAGVEIVDLYALYREARKSSSVPLYLAQDSHWSPAGVQIAAAEVANRLKDRGWIKPGSIRYELRSAPVQRVGDIVRMARSPQMESRVTPEEVICTQVFGPGGLQRYEDDPASEVLVLGDSFLRIYQQDEPGHAGFVAHLAAELGWPVASIVNDGGASTLVRQELFRRPKLLAHKKVVVWEFVERDLRLGTEGWQIVPLPPAVNTTRVESDPDKFAAVETTL